MTTTTSVPPPQRPSVRGSLFVDYVRMIHSRTDLPWSQYLEEEDLTLVTKEIDRGAWYPMESFERLGLAILKLVAQEQLQAVHMWGRFQTEALVKRQPELISPGDPRDTLYRFQTIRRSFFSYDALVVADVDDESARVAIQYGMSPRAEEAAAHQARGFFERLLEMAGAAGATGRFESAIWTGHADTSLRLAWTAKSS